MNSLLKSRLRASAPSGAAVRGREGCLASRCGGSCPNGRGARLKTFLSCFGETPQQASRMQHSKPSVGGRIHANSRDSGRGDSLVETDRGRGTTRLVGGRAALASGKHFVTAKTRGQWLASHGTELVCLSLAEDKTMYRFRLRRRLAAASPFVKSLSESFIGTTFTRGVEHS